MSVAPATVFPTSHAPTPCVYKNPKSRLVEHDHHHGHLSERALNDPSDEDFGDLPELVRRLVTKAHDLGRPHAEYPPAFASGIGWIVGARMETPGDQQRKVTALASVAPDHPEAYEHARRYLANHRMDDRASWFASQLMEEAFFRVSRRSRRSAQQIAFA